MSRITELGYLGFSISDLEKWKAFACGVAGMEFVDEGEGDRVYLRMDEWHHRITLHLNGVDDLAYMGLRVAGPHELAAMARKLKDAGVAFRHGTAHEAATRRVMGLIKMADPHANAVEIFWGPQVDRHKPFHPGRPMFGKFLTGSQGMGHILLPQPDIKAAIRFYEALGLEGAVEYLLTLPDGNTMELAFMHANNRQHTIAFGLMPGEKHINHLMVEYTDRKDLGLAHDLVLDNGTPVTRHLGMHANDEQLSFYPVNPSGWLWELGWGGREALPQQEYYIHDMFGLRPGDGGYGLDIQPQS
jgi:2,3-dihydroxybiphenyl 1,2-dioxygenase